MKKIQKQEGITLFVTLVLMGVLLGVSASLLNITLKQYQLAGVSYASEIAFQAANAGMECALYHDWVNNSFDVPGNDTDQINPVEIDCFGAGNYEDENGPSKSSEEQKFEFTFSSNSSDSNDDVCTEFSVYKFYSDSGDVAVTIDGDLYKDVDCKEGSECTVVQSRGYNVICDDIGTAARVVEREYTQVY